MENKKDTKKEIEDYIYKMGLTGETCKWIRNQVDEKIENHYPEYEVFFFMEGFNIDIHNSCKILYGDIIQKLLQNNQIDNINNIDREELIYGENSINKKIIELIDKIIETEETY